jgi:ribosomal protein L11
LRRINKFTTNLAPYFIVKVIIYIYENRTFSFKVQMASTSFFLNLLKTEKKIQIKYHDRLHDKIILCIKLNNLIKLALFKFPLLNIKYSLYLI